MAVVAKIVVVERDDLPMVCVVMISLRANSEGTYSSRQHIRAEILPALETLYGAARACNPACAVQLRELAFPAF
jgi:hypothetical protein